MVGMRLPGFSYCKHGCVRERSLVRSDFKAFHSYSRFAEPAPLASTQIANKKMNNTKTTIPTQGSQSAALDADILLILEPFTQPLGVFSGEGDRIVRIRNGKIIPPDTGNQVGGQN